MARLLSRNRPTMQACLLAAVLVFAVPADAGWLDRARGIGTGAQVYAQVSAFRSIKQNLGTLTNLFGDMLDAVGEGDDERVGEIWSDIQGVPEKIVRDAFPVLGLVESAADALDGAQKRLGEAKSRIERLVDKSALASLVISRDERPFYEWTAGIVGDEPLPANGYAQGTGIDERSGEASGNDDREADVWSEASLSSETLAEIFEARSRYDEALKGLDQILAGSSGVRDRGEEFEKDNYQAMIDTLDRRRTEYHAERHEQAVAAPPTPSTELANGTMEDAGARTAQETGEPIDFEPQVATGSVETWESEQDDRCRITCRQGSVCVEYTLDDPGDCEKFSAQCQDSPDVYFERGHTCDPGLACRQQAPQRVSLTYDPSIGPTRFEELCVGNHGQIVR